MEWRHGRITSAVAVGFSRGLGGVCYWMDFCILARRSYQPAALSRGGVSSFASRACTSSSAPHSLVSARSCETSVRSAASSARKLDLGDLRGLVRERWCRQGTALDMRLPA